MASKSAADTLSVFKEILSDIDLTCQQSQHEPSKLILQHIVATMSDRAATEVTFNTLLKDYRDTTMPTVVDNYELLNHNVSVSKIKNYFKNYESTKLINFWVHEILKQRKT